MEGGWPQQIKVLREQLGLNQQSFSELLGLSTRSVSQWERGKAVPRGLSVVKLHILRDALGHHPRHTVIDVLRRSGSKPLPLVRALVRLTEPPPAVPASR